MRERANVAKTIHLPAQSGSSTCLERMRRGYTREAYLELVNKIKDTLPDVALTSDFIAGFCGETIEEHNDTISLMKMVKYSFCFMYAYSMREKTKAYHRLKDDVPNEVKNKRYLEMVDTFRACAAELNRTKLNQIHLVLIDKISKRSEDEYSGRNDNNTIVHFEKTQLPFVNNISDFKNLSSIEKKMPLIGDYVACKLIQCTSHSFKSIPLFTCNLQTFSQLKNSSILE
jgi:tRNA A37 methylthiotransferase MiaB